MTIDEIKGTISDLISVEPKSIGTDRDAREASVWVLTQKQIEEDVKELLDPEIKKAFAAHRKLSSEKKTLLEKLEIAKDRVRASLANWIAAGHSVEGCYKKTLYRVTIVNPEEVPEEYTYRAIDEKKIAEWAKLTEGQQTVPGCTIEAVHILYAGEKL